jgi:hypothetical protein
MGLKMAQHRAPSHFKEEPGHDSVSATFAFFLPKTHPSPTIPIPAARPHHIEHYFARVVR